MKISIVVPTLNSEKYLKQCLDSIFRQSYKNVEVIVVDGYSKDKTHRILKDYEALYPKRFYTAFRRPQGEPDAINIGIGMSCGDIVAFIDSDDVYQPGVFEAVADYLKAHEDVMLVYGRADIIDGKGRKARNAITAIKEPFQVLNKQWLLLLLDYIVQPTVFMRREIINDIGVFRTDEELVCDYEYWLRASDKGYKFGFIDRHLASSRVHPGTMSMRNQTKEISDAFRWKVRYAILCGKPWLVPFQCLEYCAERLIYKL